MKILQTTLNNYFKEINYKSSNDTAQLIIDENTKYQKIIGFGGAFTDAACSIYNMLNDNQKKEVLEAYFSQNGLNYNLGRLTIGSCDFSRTNYDYSYKEDLSDFSIEHDKKEIFNFVKDAQKLSNIIFMASPWSPPKMFKDTLEKCHGGKLNWNFADNYAEYYCKYIQECKKENINISYLSIQNEPAAIQSWESCIYTPQEEAKFAKILHSHLKDNSLDNVKLLLWDHNRDIIKERVDGYYEIEGIDNIIEGFAYHWYDNYCSSNLSIIHKEHPNKLLLFSEGCIELLNLNKDNPSEAIGSIANALRYGKNYILDCLNYSNGFIDWNLLLDEKGGPNHVCNYCEALIMYDTINKNLIYNPSYYVVKHFAHFIGKDSIRINSNVVNDVLNVAFINKNNQIVVIILNEENEKEITINIRGNNYKVILPRHSITTLVE